MNLEEKIKEEIYEYISKFNLNKEELGEIDTYVLNIIENFKFVLSAQENVFKNKENVEQLKKLILESIGE
jgi:predicted house-cleaning noncanonical NTP pyrophosphatase (MazG superfamily)